MKFVVVTLFPEMFASMLSAGVLGRAIDKHLIEVEFVNPRDFSYSKHGKVDDTPYGGGPGMVIEAEPVIKALEQAKSLCSQPPRARAFALTPCGPSFHQARAEELSSESDVILICGRYEGIDERLFDSQDVERISTGDYVLSGGEIAALNVIDAVSRLVPGVLGDQSSAIDESFSEDLLEYPQYTKPRSVDSLPVPEVLIGGNHQKIREWRKQKSIERTSQYRPDLIAKYFRGRSKEFAKRVFVVLAHHPVTDRNGKVVTTSITNLDLHDIARTTKTYGLGGFYVVTPVTLQKKKAEAMLHTWNHEIDQNEKDDRLAALNTVSIVSSASEAESKISKRFKGKKPIRVCTSARLSENQIHENELKAQICMSERPISLIFGTGWGLTPQFLAESDYCLEPIEHQSEFNHLSVRSAVAILCDRLFKGPVKA